MQRAKTMNDELIDLIYVRISTTKQDEGDSPQLQEEACQRKAVSEGFPEVLPRYIWSEIISGRKQNRPKWDDLIRFCKENKGKVRSVIVYKIDRLTRGGAHSYESYRKELEDLGIKLLDSYGIIQPQQNTLEHTGFTYPWSTYRPSETNEIVQAQHSKEEVRTTLTRTIGAEIGLTQQGYLNRSAPYGYKIEKRFTPDGKKRAILLPLEVEAKFVKKIFNLRSKGFEDKKICEVVNDLGFKTRERNRYGSSRRIIGKIGGKKLTPKMLQRLVARPIYCGIIREKWTNYLPVRAKFDGLISFGTFNKANQGKITIKTNDDEITIHEGQIKKRRHKFHPHFLFKGMILCPKCKNPFLSAFLIKRERIPMHTTTATGGISILHSRKRN